MYLSMWYNIFMKLKSKLQYLFYKYFPKKYVEVFDRFYKHRLNHNLIELQKKGLDINVIFDIGAYKGEWSKFLNNTSLKNKSFFLFEANEKNKNFLQKSGFKFFLNVLSDQKKKVKFHSNLSTGDSYFIEQTSFYKQNIKTILKETTTIDELVAKEKLPLPDLIKIDTQGSELDILKGAKKSIRECTLIYLECPIIEYNLNAPKLNEYLDYLKSINFFPLDICEVHRNDNILIQIDILFIEKDIFKKINPGKKILNLLN